MTERRFSEEEALTWARQAYRHGEARFEIKRAQCADLDPRSGQNRQLPTVN